MSGFELAQEALGDLQDNWEHLSEDSFDLADRIFLELLPCILVESGRFASLLRRLARFNRFEQGLKTGVISQRCQTGVAPVRGAPWSADLLISMIFRSAAIYCTPSRLRKNPSGPPECHATTPASC